MSNTTSERIQLVASDGARLSAYHARPEGPARGGVVVVQEIFGVNEHIRQVADGFAELGYEAIAPALFDRVEPNFEVGYDDLSMQRARALMSSVDIDKALLDVSAAIEKLSGAGKRGIVGYCWGGTVAYLAGARLSGLSVAVGYYGRGIVEYASERPRVPTLLHYGEHDKSIPLSDIEKVRVQRPELDVRVYPAGHGFNCNLRGSYDKPSADLALSRTLSAFEQYLG